MPSTPLAYFLTWTTYGSWLHGDERWSIDRDHNVFRGESIPPDVRRETAARSRLANPGVRLNAATRAIVDSAIREHAHVKGWNVHALNVRTNHAHAVITAQGVAPEIVLVQSKSWATRALRREGLVASTDRVWTTHGSTRYLWDRLGVQEAIRYVTDGQ